jgi:hypothetical protein
MVKDPYFADYITPTYESYEHDNNCPSIDMCDIDSYDHEDSDDENDDVDDVDTYV